MLNIRIFFYYLGYPKSAEYLLQNGVDVNAIDIDGATSLDIAEQFGNLNMLNRQILVRFQTDYEHIAVI